MWWKTFFDLFLFVVVVGGGCCCFCVRAVVFSICTVCVCVSFQSLGRVDIVFFLCVVPEFGTGGDLGLCLCVGKKITPYVRWQTQRYLHILGCTRTKQHFVALQI